MLGSRTLFILCGCPRAATTQLPIPAQMSPNRRDIYKSGDNVPIDYFSPGVHILPRIPSQNYM
jgi:hypothetical protein